MNLSFLLPSAFAALLAVAVPLLIHLSRRSEQTLTDFAALRWLRANLRPRRKFLFQERLLLALRILLLIALALFLAQPVVLKKSQPENWVLVVPGSDYSAEKNLPAGKNVRWHWLAPGFPELEDPATNTNLPLSSLLRELDATLPAATRLTVLVPSQLSGLDAERVQLSRAVDWRVLAGKMPSQPNNLKPAPLKLAVRFDAEHAPSVRFFRASYAAWQSQSPEAERNTLDSAEAQAPLPKTDVALVWLVSGDLPENLLQWVASGGSVVLSAESTLPGSQHAMQAWSDHSWQSRSGESLVASASIGDGRIWKLQQTLSPQAMPALLETDFPERLQALFSTPSAGPTQSLASLHKPLKTMPAWPELPTPLSAWLIWLIAVLFLLERWAASAKNRWSSV